MHATGMKLVSMLLIAALFGMVPCAHAVDGGSSSDGAAITLGIFVGACILLLVIGLRADYENVFGQNEPLEMNVDEETFASRISLVLERPEFSGDRPESFSAEEASAESIALGLRVDF